ncbi:MAG: hypothetical protein KDD43_16845, partial [Bdellovibrionales bacterium]|nr:hypothetical protein [Bdellovibrionales bacterium]
MGTIRDTQTGQSLGTCVLIAENLVLMARHAIEGRNVPYLDVTFGYTEFLGKTHSAGHTLFESVIENDPSLDYAIVKLKGPIGKRLGFVSLNTQDHTVSEPALLHYPLGKPLKVSVHAFDQTPYQTQFLLTYHDSDSFSSGGSYFDPYGRLSALHLGSQYDGKTLNLLRYALPLRKIVTHHPTSILHKFATRELSQSRSYTSQDALTYLPFTDHQFLMDEEGYQSEKVLRRLLGSRVQTDRNIRKTQRGAISFSPTNLQYIATTYPAIYRAFQKECLGVTGVHAWTKQFSVTGVIESDHT